jgi:hypothetical protein
VVGTSRRGQSIANTTRGCGCAIHANRFSLISRDTANQPRTLNHRHITTWNVFHTTLHAQSLTATFARRSSCRKREGGQHRVVHTDVMLQNVMTKTIFLLPSPLPTTPPRASRCWTLAANHTQTTIVGGANARAWRSRSSWPKGSADRPPSLCTRTHTHAHTHKHTHTHRNWREGRGGERDDVRPPVGETHPRAQSRWPSPCSTSP